jgi:hypothetical protein
LGQWSQIIARQSHAFNKSPVLVVRHIFPDGKIARPCHHSAGPTGTSFSNREYTQEKYVARGFCLADYGKQKHRSGLHRSEKPSEG